MLILISQFLELSKTFEFPKQILWRLLMILLTLELTSEENDEEV